MPKFDPRRQSVTMRATYGFVEKVVVIVGILGIALFGFVRSRNTSIQLLETTKVPIEDFRRILPQARLIAGPDSARYSVVEFFDYECFPCRQQSPEIIAAVQSTGGTTSLLIQNFPLAMHPHAKALARIATQLEGEEFEDFHTKAFSLSDQPLQTLVNTWGEKLTQRNRGWRLLADRQLDETRLAAERAMVNATPTLFFIDRKQNLVYRCSNVESLRHILKTEETAPKP